MQKTIRYFILAGLLVALTGALGRRNDWWTNPGGKWMPQQMVEHGDTLKRLGLEIEPSELSDPSSNLLQGIVSLGGCSGSFISKEGLIISNHHCVEGNLAYLSQDDLSKGKESDYVRDGFIARTRTDERQAPVTQKIYVTDKITDVTDRVRAGLEQITDPARRAKVAEKRINQIVKESEAENKFYRSEVRGFFRGMKYYLVERLELKDIRMVYAPPAVVGYFGGDEHNWHWPRFVGDFSLMRAYVSPSGEPAAYSAENVPYVPKNIIKVSRDGILPDDLVLVAGYPGLTQRLNTAQEMANLLEVSTPALVERLTEQLVILHALAKSEKALELKLSSTIFGLENTLKNRKSGLEAIEKIGFMEKKRQFHSELKEWIQADGSRVIKYLDAINALDAASSQALQGWNVNNATLDIASQPGLLASVVRTVRKITQSTLPDEDRRSGFQERDLSRLRDADAQLQKRYDRRIDVGVLKLMVSRAMRVGANDALVAVLGADYKDLDDAAIGARIDALYADTALENLDARLKFFNEGTVDAIQASTDPLVIAARQLAVLVEESLTRSDKRAGDLALIEPTYVQALQEFKKSRGELLAPDANSTLRITFGLVQGYRKPSDGKWYTPFTYLDQLVNEQHKYGEKDFEVPDNIRKAYATGNHEPFIDHASGRVPLNFLANVDTTGGNSGSAALNSRGELVGLLFDGDEETLYSDYMFDSVVRSILVDIRYFLWTLHNVEKADGLLEEIGVKLE